MSQTISKINKNFIRILDQIIHINHIAHIQFETVDERKKYMETLIKNMAEATNVPKDQLSAFRKNKIKDMDQQIRDLKPQIQIFLTVGMPLKFEGEVAVRIWDYFINTLPTEVGGIPDSD